jgi:hypothetical protein
MDSDTSIETFVPCPDPECDAGFIMVHNAYSSNPLKGEEEMCDTCKGLGVVPVFSRFVAAD